MSEKSDLQKQAQAYLKEAREVLKKAAACAEEGKFDLRFLGATYVPKSGAGGCETEEELTEEQRQELEDNGLYLYEYQPLGSWWVPSNC